MTLESEEKFLLARKHKINQDLAKIEVCKRCPFQDDCKPKCEFRR